MHLRNLNWSPHLKYLEDPYEDIERMFQFSDSILFSTELQPQDTFSGADDWCIFPQILDNM